MNTLARVNKGVARGARIASQLILSVLTITVAYQVISRYVPDVPRIMWTEELARAALVWLVFLSATFAVSDDAHFKIDLLPERLHPRVRAIIDIVASFLVCITLAFLLVGSVTFFLNGFSRISTMSGVSLAWSYLALPLSFAMMLLKYIEYLIQAIKSSYALKYLAKEGETI
ncbi:TRAP transporter small permease [Halomonas dongshanensis]|uniref:TRAP transporter small permease protein n=1 Tax=Halomonas dongshanensis TaxID=2890835 RepID=A0ABT2EAW9_9GAMM|nr:TRAP transporter small permease [Halomonas dongshanensis]MCS2608727.1 TRAP transporter small permease [Halomonas dongshanensis]